MEQPSEAALAERKLHLRRSCRTFRRSLDPVECAARSAQICARIRSLPVWSRARTVGVYHALPGEVELGALLQHAGNKTVLWPVVVQSGAPLVFRDGLPTVRGPFGILEPSADAPSVPLREVDLVVVPGLAFDEAGRRLGQGGGFYDRTLVKTDAVRMAVCFREQLIPRVPAGELDCLMDLVVHERGVIQVS
jgi:5-formyltetrahydrofolate cyclo-ligase